MPWPILRGGAPSEDIILLRTHDSIRAINFRGVPMRSPSPSVVALVLCTAVTPRTASQIAEHIVGAPFTATRTLYREGDDRPSVTQIARASDGSVYCGSYGSDGRLFQVEIEDVPNNRRIFYFPSRLNDHSYTQSAPTYGFLKLSIEQERDRARTRQRHWAEDPDLQENNRRTHFTPLGERPGDGMILFGVRVETTYESGEKRVDERWESDLGLMMSSTDIRSEKEDSYSVVTNLRRQEPDPTLFQIPKEYLSDPVLDANTIFIDNQTGSPEVLHGALAGLDLWKKSKPLVKPLAIAKEKNAGDLTATFTRVPMNRGPMTSGLKLQVFLRDSSDPVFEYTEGSSGSAAIDERAGRICIAQFWNRLANTHVGLRQTESHSSRAPTAE
jgi:hypothetical protein